MKKTILALVLGLSSTALAGGNDGILIMKSNVLELEQLLVSDAGGIEIADLKIGKGPIVIVPGWGGGLPTSPGGGPLGPGGTDGEVVPDVFFDGGVETETMASVYSDAIEAALAKTTSGDVHFATQQPTAQVAAVAFDQSANIQSVKYVWESKDGVLIWVNGQMTATVSLDDAQLDAKPEIKTAIAKSYTTGEWVDVK